MYIHIILLMDADVNVVMEKTAVVVQQTIDGFIIS